MDEHKALDYALAVMKNLNLIIILYMGILIFNCLWGYVQENSALEFLSRIDTIPPAPWKIPVIAVMTYSGCLLLMGIRGLGGISLISKVAVEMTLCFLVSYLLGFGYNGMLLLVLADKLDSVFPGLLTAVFIIICWFLMAKKRMSPIKVMLVLVVVAFVGVLVGFFNPGLAY